MTGRVEPVVGALPQAILGLTNELGAAQARLGQIVGMLQTAGEALKSGRPTEASVRQIIEWRSRRARFFDPELFGDPAWDMLLELYASELGQRRITVSNLCMAGGVPGTTALRWLNILEQRGLAKRKNDPLDRRRLFVSLTPAGLTAMESFFQEQAQPRMAA